MNIPADVPPYESLTHVLTAEEIEYLCLAVPKYPPYSKTLVFPKAAEDQQNRIRDRLRRKLKGKKCDPVALSNVLRILKHQYNSTLVTPGKAVGLDCTQSIGEVTQQATLNTFHLAGKKTGVTGGIKSFQELIKASANRTAPTVIIHFKNPNLDIFDIMALKHEIIHVSLFDLIIRDTSMNMMEDDIFNTDVAFADGYPYWYELYMALNPDVKKFLINEVKGDRVYRHKWFLRLYIDIDALYSLGISIHDVSNNIENSGDNIKCIPSPINLGIVDVYYKGDSNDENNSLSYLSTIVYQKLMYITMSGINKVTNLIPAHIKIIQTITKEYPIEFEIKEQIDHLYRTNQTWLIEIDGMDYYNTNLKIEKMVDLLKHVGYAVPEIRRTPLGNGTTFYRLVVNKDIEEESPLYLIGKNLPEFLAKGSINAADGAILQDIVDQTEITALDKDGWHLNLVTDQDAKSIKELFKKFYYDLKYDNGNYTIPLSVAPRKIIGEAINKETELERETREKGLYFDAKLRRLSRYYYAFTVGDNLIELLSHPEVDPYHTYSNNINNNIVLFGIEMARTFFIKEFYNILDASNSTLNISQIMMLADYVTRYGYISKATSRETVHKDGTNILSKLPVVDAMPTLMKASIFGVRDENIGDFNTSALLTGKVAKIGTSIEGYSVPYQICVDRLRQEEETGSHLIRSIDTTDFAIQYTVNENTSLQTAAPVQVNEDYINNLINGVLSGPISHPIKTVNEAWKPPVENTSVGLPVYVSRINRVVPQTAPCNPPPVFPRLNPIFEYPENKAIIDNIRIPVVDLASEVKLPRGLSTRLNAVNTSITNYNETDLLFNYGLNQAVKAGNIDDMRLMISYGAFAFDEALEEGKREVTKREINEESERAEAVLSALDYLQVLIKNK